MIRLSLTMLLALIVILGCNRDAEVELSLHIKELRCADGQHLMESYLLEMPGIRAVAANLETHQLTIQYRTRFLEETVIRNTLLEKGFTVDDRPGEPNARRRLPSCCLEPDSTLQDNASP